MNTACLSAKIASPPAPAKTAGREINPFCVENNLHSWVSSRIIYRGRDYYRKGRVSALETFPGNRMEAMVEGSMREPYRVRIAFDKWGMPVSECTCPYTFEPLCKHAVAVLLAWQQQETGDEPKLGGLPDEAVPPATGGEERSRYIRELAAIEINDRVVRCGEQGLKIIGKPGNFPLGAYEVSSGNPELKTRESYKVTVRDAQWKHASCNCLDYRTNELGTCKHIEIVKRHFNNRERNRRLIQAALADKSVAVYFRPRESHEKIYGNAENIRFYVPPGLGLTAERLLPAAADSQGWFLADGRDPEAQLKHFKALLSRVSSALGNKGKIEVDPLVWAGLDGEAEAFNWEKRISGIAQHPARHSQWNNSVGGLKIRLHPYQVEGILFAAKKRRAFIGDDMGLGKTAQAIGTALLLKELGAVHRAVIFCPASLKFQWRNEIGKISAASAAVVSGGARERAELYKTSKDFFFILNYELLYRDLDAIADLSSGLVILDEAQRIKNWETKVAKTIKRLESPFRLVLTGTPIQNKLPEFQSIAEFLHPRALGAPWKLVPTYARFDADDRISGYTNLDHLRRRMDGFFIRRTREAVLSQLPKRTDNNFWTDLTQAQRQEHDALANQVRRVIARWEKLKRITKEDIQRLMTLLACMRIVSNAYGQYDWKSVETEALTARRASAEFKKKTGSPKLEEFQKVAADLLEDPGQKIVVFSQWERMIRLADIYIREILESSNSRSVVFCGALPLRRRETEVKRFLDDPQTRVFFSTDAGGQGLNLQHAANCVINLEIPWNPAVMEQRIGRVYRMGQKKSVQAINFISSESIEERIFNLVAQKKALFSGLFDKGENEIRFNALQTASFMDKMKMIVPQAPAPQAREEAGTGKIPPEEAVSDTTAKVCQSGPAGESGGSPSIDFDLGPVVSAVSGLLQLPGERTAAAGGLKMKISEDQEGVHLSIPKPAVEILKGFKPALESLLKLIS
ncbi:MAG: Non-specific serine/threonine protein kinase [Elusimicrobia bacterium]|nr:MAG: Non-specific serine/threonine protein kinase [Elusimicrobiota bacterium]KAF0155867.1 MAG: Non-specific serine/threonine protein kinase [Elusimicrobiota bacterium]